MDLSSFFRGNIFIFLYLFYIGNEKMFKSFIYFYVPFLTFNWNGTESWSL